MSQSPSKRRKTREVLIGSVGVGGENPIQIQSMTTTDTRDVEATVSQIIRLQEAGCAIARVTVQGMKEAESCEAIKNRLLQLGAAIPLVADIHFYPPAALRVVDSVDKVRINPGNYVDRRATFRQISYDDASYQSEIDKIDEKFSPLVLKCKQGKKAIRIGVNHGSLSDRIMNRYGDTPWGMVESALEFARVCRSHDFHNFLFSMKASNPKVMIEAYRLLVQEMDTLGWDYPLHLGVTEAGEGLEGRVKSAIGIGSLLLEGIGDTIRVSLTEEPEAEISPCKRLVTLSEELGAALPLAACRGKERKVEFGPLHRDGSVAICIDSSDLMSEAFYRKIGCTLSFGRPQKGDRAADFLLIKDGQMELPAQLKRLEEIGIPSYPLCQLGDPVPRGPYGLQIRGKDRDRWGALTEYRPLFILFTPTDSFTQEGREFFQFLTDAKLSLPVLLYPEWSGIKNDLPIQGAALCGSLLIDGLGEGIAVDCHEEVCEWGFQLLQGCRMRSSKTEFISCPGCGRTLFDLQSVSKRIREQTDHLPGVKIAIMGCIVNGPGEMADADFGYVGSKTGKIDLYVGKKCVERDIDESIADLRLIDLIKSHGRWLEKETSILL